MQAQYRDAGCIVAVTMNAAAIKKVMSGEGLNCVQCGSDGGAAPPKFFLVMDSQGKSNKELQVLGFPPLHFRRIAPLARRLCLFCPMDSDTLICGQGTGRGDGPCRVIFTARDLHGTRVRLNDGIILLTSVVGRGVDTIQPHASMHP